jgi:hypothetical protein
MAKDKECNHNHNHGGNGFMMGAMIGAGLTLLFTTEKGRKILRELSEEGFSKLGEYVDLEEMGLKDNESFHEVEETEIEEKTPKKRRIFRGVRKK